MATKIAKTSTIHGKRLQAVTIATTNLAMGTEAIGFENGVVFGVFVDVAMRCSHQSEKKPAKAPLTQKYGCGVAPMPPGEPASQSRAFPAKRHAGLATFRGAHVARALSRCQIERVTDLLVRQLTLQRRLRSMSASPTP
jgi:hypothetical protein